MPTNKIKVAVLVDGSFFLARYKTLYKNKRDFDPKDPEKVANDLYEIVNKHTKGKYLYRVLYYDAKPLEKKVIHPITGKQIDFSVSDVCTFRKAFYEKMKIKRKVALRLGFLSGKSWLLRAPITHELLKGTKALTDIKESDVYLDIKQKGVDIRIGLDIASLAYKRLVDQVVLISGDSDFIPAAKLARREGIDVVLDPMRGPINQKLLEHVDGITTYAPTPGSPGDRSRKPHPPAGNKEPTSL